MKKTAKTPKTAILAVLLAVLALSLGVNLTLSYLVRKKTAHNVFTVGAAELTIEETSFPSEPSDRWLVPKSFLPKNPCLVNTGTTDEYVFMEVTVPYENAQLILDQGENIRLPDPAGKQPLELFNLLSNHEAAVSGASTPGFSEGFTITNTGSFTYHPNWIFLSCGENTESHTHTYLFGYRSLLPHTPGHNTTDCIFDKVQLRNVLEDDLPGDIVRTITINAYGIQSSKLKDLSVNDPGSLTKDELQQIYQYYQNQEG